MILNYFMTADGRLKALPAQEKKLLVVLRHLVQDFQPGERYSENQVNEILRRYHLDTAALRRYMVDNQLLERSTGLLEAVKYTALRVATRRAGKS